jgi:hypothetical protein
MQYQMVLLWIKRGAILNHIIQNQHQNFYRDRFPQKLKNSEKLFQTTVPPLRKQSFEAILTTDTVRGSPNSSRGWWRGGAIQLIMLN